jgi:hypothetical protein
MLQGACKDPPSDEFLRKAGSPLMEELLPGQCVILSPINSPIYAERFYVVDNIYMRHPVGEKYGGLAATFGGDEAAIFLMNSTFDGADGPDADGLSVLTHYGRVYAEGEASFLCYVARL